MSNPEKRVFAGLDRDGIAKLFQRVGDEPATTMVGHADWLAILDEIGAEPGEMLLVSFSRCPPTLADRPRVRRLFGSTISYDHAWEGWVHELDDDELRYCLEHETRKTGLAILRREARQRGIIQRDKGGHGNHQAK